jgi:hypothetical protein
MKFQIIRNLILTGMLLVTLSPVLSARYPDVLGKSARLNPLKKIFLVEPADHADISKEEQLDLLSVKHVLQVAGVPFVSVPIGQFATIRLTADDIIVLPAATGKNLTDDCIQQIREAVNSGTGIFYEGRCALNGVFGLKLQQNLIEVNTIHDLLFSKTVLFWPSAKAIQTLDTTSKSFTVIAVDDSTNLPLMVTGSLGKGRYVYFANLFDPATDKGYSRYPYLIELLNLEFGALTFAERSGVEMYFDPGMNEYPLNYDKMARKWKNRMIKTIYAAGWYYDDEDVDYGKLLKACHENGISVYCWLEWPMISKKFWNDHPDWRDKNAYLQDAHIDWRYLMNLADSSCVRQVFIETGRMLRALDWDGVNLAELYFETVDDGRQNPTIFTPMNNTVRNDFKRRSGFDPVMLFDSTSMHYWKTGDTDWKKYLSYRRELISGLKAQCLRFLSDIDKAKSNFEMMLTVIDVTMVPNMSDYIGEDLKSTLALYKKYPLSVQIEDPANCWGLTPERYDKLGKYYRNYIREPHRLVFDCNVVTSHEMGAGGFPNEKPSGEEIRQIVYNMSLSGSRPAFYSEDAFFPGDFNNISTVLARKTTITARNDSTWKITTPFPAYIHTGAADLTVYLDGKPWQAGEGERILVPAGDHELGVKSPRRNPLDCWLNSISGELKSAVFTHHSMEFTYQEFYTGCYVIVNQKPASVEIDDKISNPEVLPNSTGGFSIKLPEGIHRVRITR